MRLPHLMPRGKGRPLLYRLLYGHHAAHPMVYRRTAPPGVGALAAVYREVRVLVLLLVMAPLGLGLGPAYHEEWLHTSVVLSRRRSITLSAARQHKSRRGGFLMGSLGADVRL